MYVSKPDNGRVTKSKRHPPPWRLQASILGAGDAGLSTTDVNRWTALHSAGTAAAALHAGLQLPAINASAWADEFGWCSRPLEVSRKHQTSPHEPLDDLSSSPAPTPLPPRPKCPPQLNLFIFPLFLCVMMRGLNMSSITHRQLIGIPYAPILSLPA